MQHQAAPDGKIVAITGSSGSGKTWWLKQQIAKSPRLLAWDIEGQYTEQIRAVTNIRELIQLVMKNQDMRISYQARSLDEFDQFCRVAFVYVQAGGLRGKMTDIVAEELADVTSPAKAPQGWGMLVRRARKWGGNIYGITQRPAESDKTLFGNAMIMHCCWQKRASDRAYIARELDLPVSVVTGLSRANLEFIELDARIGETTRGSINPKTGKITKKSLVL